MSTYTPGPWLREGNSVYALQQDGWRKGEPVMVNRFYAQVQFGRADGALTPHAEIEANARLIAAAPELLEALAFYVAICGNTAHSITREGAQDAYAKANAAITKARGE